MSQSRQYIKVLMNVKLNNPLMGTETISTILSIFMFKSHFVKLNNPLMGTETN